MPNNQESPEVREYRNQQRASAFMRKGNRCDMCGHYATEFHECCHRSSTLNNPEARRLSFQQELCGCLCKPCHEKAHSEKATMKILQNNVAVYGYEAVKNALNALQDVLKGKLAIWLWEKTDG